MRVDLIRSDELRLIFDMSGPGTIDIGTLQQDASIPAYINVDEMVRKHFAVFGTTGVGKSSGVALLLRQVLEARPDLRVFLIDPHNEYGHCFDDRAQVLSPKNLKLPFWLFNFEEIVDVFFRGRPGVEEEVEILSELIPIAKAIFRRTTAPAARRIVRNDPKSSGFTVDTPVPYRLEDLIRLIDERMGKLENRSAWAQVSPADHAHRDRAQRSALQLHVRQRQCRRRHHGGDALPAVPPAAERHADDHHAARRLPGRGGRLGGLGAAAAWRSSSACGATARSRCSCVCEEAHRYAPADRSIGFGPTRKAVSRIAKEGRKYGVFLGLITQRPAELDATIISQCSTLFAMRMANDRDQAIVRSAVSDAAGSPARLRALARHPRGVRLRRRRGAADPAALQGAARRHTFRTARRSRRASMDSATGVDVGFLVVGGGALARRHHGQPDARAPSSARWRRGRARRYRLARRQRVLAAAPSRRRSTVACAGSRARAPTPASPRPGEALVFRR